MAPFTHRLRVRYHECDPQEIVFNANYFSYFDVTLTELWRAAFDGASYSSMIADHGVDLVVAEATARFHGSARFDDELDIDALVTRLGTTGMTTRFTVRRGTDELVVGEIRHVFVDAKTWDKTPMPQAVRAALERYAAPA